MKKFLNLLRRKGKKNKKGKDPESDCQEITLQEQTIDSSSRVQNHASKSSQTRKSFLEPPCRADLPRDADDYEDDCQSPRPIPDRNETVCQDLQCTQSNSKTQDLVPSDSSNVSALANIKRLLDPNSLARVAAPQPLNNFMHRLPTIERLESEGLYTLYDPTVKLISEVTEEVGDQLSQLLSPRQAANNPIPVPRITNGSSSGTSDSCRAFELAENRKLLTWKAEKCKSGGSHDCCLSDGLISRTEHHNLLDVPETEAYV